MAAPKGNRFWEARSSHGRKPIFSSPEHLWEACCEYFEWNESNPLWETKSYQYQGMPVQDKIPKMRAMTKEALYSFLDITRSCWDSYKAREGFSAVTTRVEETIYRQKLEGSAAEFLNANIIARDLGLADKNVNENKHSFENISDAELEARIRALENELKGKAD